MSGLLTRLAFMMLLAVNAHALTGERLPLRDGPGDEGRDLAPVWVMRCPSDARLIGVRLREDGQIVSIQAVCARLGEAADGVRWLTEPMVVVPPAPPALTAATAIDAVQRQDGAILHASSSGVARFRGSKALVISVGGPKSGSDSQELDAPVAFRESGRSRDLLCASGQYVAGLRTGAERSRRSERLSALQLICADGTARGRQVVGPWPEEKAARKSRRTRMPAPLTVGQTECGKAMENPHDGAAVRALFGTVDNGRVQTVGITCARTIGGEDGQSALVSHLRAAAFSALRAMKWRSVYEEPRWLDGRPLAACARRSGTGRACNQESADRFCSERKGYREAVAWAVGPFATSSVGVTGEECERRSCRMFAHITCSF